MRVATGIVGAGIGFAFAGPAGLRWGYAIGSLLGSILFPPATAKVPKINPSQLTTPTSQYGIPVQVVYGSRKISGNLIWYDNFIATPIKQKDDGGGGLGKGLGGSKSQTVGYEYSVSIAFGLCMSLSPRKTVIRAWVNKEELGLEHFKVYDGSQLAGDPHMSSFVPREAVMKNVCYVVFENYSLGSATNIPAFQFEVSDVPACPTVSDTTFISSAGGYENGDLIYDNGYVYKGTNDSPSKIEKVDTADMTLDSTLVLGEDFRTQTSFKKLGRVGEEKLWAMTRWIGNQGHYTKLYRIDPVTFTVELERFIGSVVLGTDSKPYICWKDHVSNPNGSDKPITGASAGLYWEEVTGGITHDGLETWVSGKRYFRCASGNTSAFTYSVRTNKIYWISQDPGNDCTVFEVDPFLITTLRSAVVDDVVAISEAKADNNYIYIAEAASDSHIVKVNPADMTEVGRFQPSPTTGWLWFEAIEGFLYVLTAGAGKFYKVDPLDMTEVTSITPPATGNPRDIVEGWSGVMIVGSTQVHRFALDDLALVCTITYETLGSGDAYGAYDRVGAYGDLFVSRDTSAGDPSNEIYKIESPAGNDVLPGDVIEDALVNDLYGIGLPTSFINAGNFNATRAQNTIDDFFVSFVFGPQRSILDLIGYVIQHHNGYIRYSGGKISHMQLMASDPVVATITKDELVEAKGKPPLRVRRGGHRQIFNRVNAEFTNRAKEYVNGVAYHDSITDVDKHRLKATTARVDGFCTFERASKIADLLLRKSLVNARGFSFKLGPKSIGFLIGEVVTLVDAGVEVNAPVRIGSIGEGANNTLDITAVERVAEVFEFRVGGEDTTDDGDIPNIGGDAPPVVNPIAVELPALYSKANTVVAITYGKPNALSWAGTSLYRSYTEASGYGWVHSTEKSGVTGRVVGLGESSDSIKYIDVLLDYDDTLFSATDFDELMVTPGMNLCMFEITANVEIYCRFASASLQSPRVWRLSELIYDTVGFTKTNTYGSISNSIRFAMADDVPHGYVTIGDEHFRTLYFKIASYNHRGREMAISDAVMVNEYVDALGLKPLVPANIKVNEVGLNSSGNITVTNATDMDLEWRSRNRFNTGGYNTNRIDGVGEDLDFKSFELQIYKGAVLKETITQTGKTYTYDTTMQSAHGAADSTIDFKLRQHGDSHSSDWKLFSLIFT